MTPLPTLLEAVLLAVVAVASGVHGLMLQNPSATSEPQQGLHMNSHAIKDSISHSAEAQDSFGHGGAGRALQGWRNRWSRRWGPSPSGYADATATAVVAGGGSTGTTISKSVNVNGNSVTSTAYGGATAIAH